MFFKLRNFVILVLLLSAQSVNGDITLPVIGVDSSYQLNKEKEIGKAFYKRLQRENKVIKDPLINYYLKEIIYVLLQGLDQNFREYEVAVIDDASINAFAVPGGFIGVNYGLIFVAENEAQLAGVLAHEISHIKLRHIVQMIDKQSEISSTVLASLFLAIVLSQSDNKENNSEAIEALVFGSTAGAQQSMINFTRENEYEADRKGLAIMEKSGYPAIGMAEFFSILEGRVGSGELADIEYLRTHPVGANRMGEAYQFRVSESKKNDFKVNYEFFKVYLNFVIKGKNQLLIESNSAKQFNKALSFLNKNLYKEAQKLLKELLTKEEGNIWITFVLLKLEMSMGSYTAALTRVENALSYRPNSSIWISKEIEILMAKNDYQSALNLAVQKIAENNNNQNIRFKLVSIYEKLGRDLAARKTEADYHYHEGNYERAKYLYRFVKEETSDLNEKKELADKIKIIENIKADKKQSEN